MCILLGGLHNAVTAERLELESGYKSGSKSVTIADVPGAPRRGMAVAAMRDVQLVYAIGGHTGGHSVVQLVYALDARAGTWSAAPSLSISRAYAAAVRNHDGSILVVGGHDGTRRLQSGEVLRRGATSWAPIAQMGRARVRAPLQAQTHPMLPSSQPCLWSTPGLTPVRRVLPSPQAYFGCAVGANGHVYVTGGHDGTSYLEACEAYDPHTDTWYAIAPLPGRRAYHGLEELHGKLYAIGGHNGETRVSTVERYDPATDRWEAVASLTIARAFLGTASDGHRLWAVGGSDAPGHGLATCESYAPEADVWTAAESELKEARCFPGVALV